jgi:hypothetical protein
MCRKLTAQTLFLAFVSRLEDSGNMKLQKRVGMHKYSRGRKLNDGSTFGRLNRRRQRRGHIRRNLGWYFFLPRKKRTVQPEEQCETGQTRGVTRHTRWNRPATNAITHIWPESKHHQQTASENIISKQHQQKQSTVGGALTTAAFAPSRGVPGYLKSI